MKKFYLLIVLLFGCWVLGQVGVTPQQKIDNTYQFEFKDLQFTLSNRAQNGSKNSHISLFVKYEDGSEEQIYHRRIFVTQNNNETGFTLTPIITKKNPKQIIVRSFINWPSGPNTEVDFPIEITTCGLQLYNKTFEPRHVHGFQFYYRKIPLHTIKADLVNGLTNTYLPGGTKVNFFAKTGFDASLYNYQYRLDGDTQWKDINSSLSTLDKLSISAEDILGSDYINHLGKKIYIRVASCKEENDYLSYSEPLPLTITTSAPKIVKSKKEELKCSYSQDGTVKLTFDRKLYSSEYMAASIHTFGVNNEQLPYASIDQNILTNQLRNSNELILSGYPPGRYVINFIGSVKDSNGDDIAMYSDGEQFSYQFTFVPPPPVEFSLTSKTDVFCFSGSDGRIRLNAKGGQNKFQYSLDMGQTWIDFNNGNEAELQQLVAGNYKIMVRDSNVCFALDEQGANKVLTVSITQPEKAIALTSTIQTPTGYGLTNGYIVADISGGTPNDDGSYSYEWKKDSPSGEVLIDEPPIFNTTPKSFTLKLNNIGSGKYYLTVKDKNYANATSNLSNCGIILHEFEVTQPDPLKVDIQVTKAISCNIANVYSNIGGYDDNQNGIPDFAEDGQLRAVVTGGVIDYKYQWQKEVGASFQDVVGETTSTLKSLIAGHYKVKIVDKNGNATEADYTLQYPEELKLSLFANSIKCNSQNEGEVMATVTGGSGAYTYAWNTGDNVAHITGLNAGFYYVSVRDGNNCPVDANIEIKQPSQLSIEEVSVAQPTCDGQSNGAIEVKVSGGELPYKVEWSNGMTGERISGLSAGTYTVKFTDKNGCFAIKDFTLTNPVPLIIDLGKDITLCSGDSKTYDAKINDPNATYVWRDQNAQIISTISTVTLAKAGTYTVTVTNSNGCSGTDNITVKNSTEVLQPNFLVTTYAFTDRIIEVINTSYLKPEKMEWVIPTEAEVVSKTEALLQIKFKDKGSYKIGLQASQGACEKLIEKEVIVETNDYAVQDPSSNTSNIKSFVITPNPNSGVYKVLIELNVERSIRIRLMDMQSREASKSFDAPKGTKFDLPFNLTLPGASYLVILETGNEVMVKKMIVK